MLPFIDASEGELARHNPLWPHQATPSHSPDIATPSHHSRPTQPHQATHLLNPLEAEMAQLELCCGRFEKPECQAGDQYEFPICDLNTETHLQQPEFPTLHMGCELHYM